MSAPHGPPITYGDAVLHALRLQTGLLAVEHARRRRPTRVTAQKLDIDAVAPLLGVGEPIHRSDECVVRAALRGLLGLRSLQRLGGLGHSSNPPGVLTKLRGFNLLSCLPVFC